MALHLNISNSLNSLADRLCHDLRQKRGTVFQPQYIVTQTEGMNVWLKHRIADQNGIAANNQFPGPNDIIQRIYFLLGGKRGHVLAPGNLKWILYKILGEQEFIRRFPDVSTYYNYDGADSNLKRLGLAEKTADLFDQYQIYRTDWINKWNENNLAGIAGENWQEFLWFRAKELVKERLPDKTLMGKFITDELEKNPGRDRLSSKLPAVHLFGLSIITDYHLDLLYRIAEICDIHFYLTNPAPEVYWFEDRNEKQMAWLIKRGYREPDEKSQGNALLNSWGRVIQDTFMMLFKNEYLINVSDETELKEPEPTTLLKKIQYDVYRASTQQTRNKIETADLEDGSLVINSCFTIRREVEVLYNYLVHLIDQQGVALSPRDIVVLTTDIDAYAPYIKAVFQNAPYKFRFTIADESLEGGDTVLSAVAALLTIDGNNFKAESVLQLLDFRFIRRRFSITDPEKLRKLVDAANIRFGIEGSTDDDTRFVSWEYGLKRIVYGLCMSGSDMFTDPAGEELIPLDRVEGSESFEVMRCCYFVQTLINDIHSRSRPRKIPEWVMYVERLVQNMICEPDQEVDEEILLLQRQMAEFNIAGEFMEEELPFEIFSRSLLQTITATRRSGSFAGGGITFCSLIPMRSIPFKVVAMLGLNFDKFPRKDTAPSFNLIENDRRRRGDRNVKDNDKHLFLDTILSAQEFLYMSYVGQSVKDNSGVPASALLDELIDYVEDGVEEKTLVRKILVRKHPLQGFSTKYQEAGNGFYDYLNVGSKQQVDVAGVESKPMALPVELDLKELIRFVKNPVEYYYRQVLGVNFKEKHSLLPETELFELNNLETWSLRQELLQSGADEIFMRRKEKVMTGSLPLKNMGSFTLQEVDEELEEAKLLLAEYTGGMPAETKDFAITLEGILLRATVDHIYGENIIFYSYSKNETKYLLEAYVQHLFLCANNAGLNFHFLSTTKKKVFTAEKINAPEALDRLAAIMLLFKKGMENPIPFYLGWEIPKKGIEEESWRDKLSKYFEDENSNPDPYLASEYRNGLFEQEDSFFNYELAATLLMLPINQIFPTYSTKS